MSKYPQEIKDNVFDLYCEGYSVDQISAKLDIRANTLSAWIKAKEEELSAKQQSLDIEHEVLILIEDLYRMTKKTEVDALVKFKATLIALTEKLPFVKDSRTILNKIKTLKTSVETFRIIKQIENEFCLRSDV